MARTFRILAKSFGGLAAAVAVLAVSAPAQAQRHGSHDRPSYGHARPMPHHDYRPSPSYRGRYHGGYRGHYRGGSDDGDGLLFGLALGAIAGAVIAGSMQAPPPVVYNSPPPSPPPVYSGY